jgi:choline dehydrogenase
VSGVILLHALTRGQVQLVSSDPSKHPKITYDAYKEDADVNRLIQGIRIAQALLNTSAVQSLQPQVLFHRLLEKEFGKDTDEYWTEYMRRFGQTLYHPVGTCRMGAANDGSSVVDSQLRVWGVQGLRVADASVMPRISSGNTNIPTALIGLKLVDTLLKEYA